MRTCRKVGNDVLADAVGKILLLGISTHIVEREDRPAALTPLTAVRFRRRRRFNARSLPP